MMGVALMMARRGLGRTAPNPSVGAVLLDPASGEILARGTTADAGRPHAETIAIAQAGARAAGTTLYVTLEPCSHLGQTPPCADAVIAAGIRRVVCAIEDPDPRVAGRGLDRLRDEGLEVVRGVRTEEAAAITRGHIVRISERRPFVTLKIAIGADGRVPQGDGKPVFVTGPEARAHGHLLRAQADAILVGAGTVRADNPLLTCRLPGMAGRSPRRVMLAGRGLTPAFQARPDVVLGDDLIYATQPVLTPLRGRVEKIRVREVGGRLWLPAVMEDLVSRGITRLLVEGGPTVWRSFAEASLLDEVAVYMAGSDWNIARAALETLIGDTSLALMETRTLGSDTLYRLRRMTA
jgi:diaminohydroxyphosphoribosylaminopyrimidine deaminase / 5-amino-6-(5-phosphoribosylamino)uracil reductase